MKGDITRILQYFSSRSKVSALYLFGSFDTPREREDSDIDLAVLLEPGVNKDGIETLKSEYYHASPSFSLRSVDIVLLNTASTFLKHHILKTGRLLLDRDPDFRKDFTARAIQGYFDYRPIERIALEGVKTRLVGRTHG